MPRGRDSRSRSPPRRGGDRGGDRGGRNKSGQGGPGTGRIVRWHDDKGFGFIKPHDGSEDLFCHVSSLLDGDGSVRDGDDVTYVKEFDDRKGKWRAIEVAVDGGGGGSKGGRKKDSRSPSRGRGRR
eukprot:TRINITY_DN1348_c0_g2_i1.p2 TRINITY_DN1348_c0_g2~~TRINITY_DN1348_c0_g2_i1.p2  ORF type:complete len:126 (-),score=21.55 TRINITY_DN1348_c0_g2_i1:164-541(-)